MKYDSLLALACSIQAKKGVYALLLGSGISRSAGIPTGWEITLDLIKKMAVLYGEKDVNDPERWYLEKFNKEPDYSEIIAKLAKTSTERNDLLRSYFEPKDTGDDHIGKPTKAHKAIAQLVKDGYIRVIITTNFDRLLENALAEIDIVPSIISNEDQLEGAMPLIHSECTIIKVHGDYMDTRIKNTEKELSEYSPQMNAFLDRVFDEFGLIICGWSGEWDIALRSCMFRAKSNRFSWYWLKKSSYGENAQKIIDFKKIEIIDIDDADSFFVDLKEKIDSLNDLAMRKHPLSTDIACSTLKRLLPDDKNVIRINDLVMDTAKELISNVNSLDWRISPDYPLIKQRIEQVEGICEPLLHLVALGCFWGNELYYKLWENCFKYIYDNTKQNKVSDYIWSNLLDYPALLVMYTMIMSCIESEKYTLLYNILNNTKSNKKSMSPVAISYLINPLEVIEINICNKALYYKNEKKVPVSERLAYILQKPLLQIVNSEDEYNNLFDKAEYFFALNYWHNEPKNKKRAPENRWTPIGRFYYKLDYWKVEDIFNKEFILKDEWLAIKAGFWDGSFETFKSCSDNVIEWLSK